MEGGVVGQSGGGARRMDGEEKTATRWELRVLVWCREEEVGDRAVGWVLGSPEATGEGLGLQ